MNEAERFLQNYPQKNVPIRAENIAPETKGPVKIASHEKSRIEEGNVDIQNYEVQQKHVIILIVGMVLAIISRTLGLNYPGGYTTGYFVVYFGMHLIIYSVVLSIVALIIAGVRRNIRKYMFPVFAWLYLSAGLLDIIARGCLLR